MEPCIQCQGRMVEVERLKNAKTRKGNTYRRRRFQCEDCGYIELINAGGARDTNPFKFQDKATKKILKKEQFDRDVTKDKGGRYNPDNL